MKCRNCRRKNFTKIVSLGRQPLSGLFYKKKKRNLKKYNLNLVKCTFCNLVQLDKSINPKKMFGSGYGYKSSASKLMINHLKEKKLFLNKNYLKKSKLNIIDIGSNDGTFLNLFKKKNFLLGVDPSLKKFKSSYKNGIHKINDFFSKPKVDNFLKKRNKRIKFDLITSFAMFYDIENPNYFCNEINSLLDDNGIWVLELSYLPLMLKNLTYDQICHEHITYYNLTVFKSIAEKNNFKIINVRLNEINGGSIEIICAKKESNLKIRTSVINKYLKDEKKIKNLAYKNFRKRIEKTKSNIINFFEENKYGQIVGYGASTKGNIILNQTKISSLKLKFICDGSSFKLGMYTPGTNIKIISKESMRKLKPKYLFVLIWSFRNEIIKQEVNFLKQGGKLVFPLPKFHIIDKKNYKSFVKKNFKSLSFKY